MPASQTSRVTFNPSVKVCETLSLCDYTTREISASWLNEEEMEKITKRCYQLLQRNSAKYCMRGLEGHTASGNISKRKNRSAAFSAVFDEQARQWAENAANSDAQSIADAYSRASSSCQMWAQAVGIRDQQAIEAYLFEENHKEETPFSQSSTCHSEKRRTSTCRKHETNIMRKASSGTPLVSATAA